MTPDPLQQAWQSQPVPPLDAGKLVQEFRTGQQQFSARIFWRDVREVAVSLVLLPVWVGMGVGIGLPWSWYLMIPGIVWIAAFMTIDRRRQKRRQAGPDAPLVRGVASAVADVGHQIWLLRNVLWWYQLPLAAPMLAFFAHCFWQAARGNMWEFTAATSVGAVFVGAVNGWVYWINQRAIRTTLEPRRQELAAMLRGLSDEPPAQANP